MFARTAAKIRVCSNGGTNPRSGHALTAWFVWARSSGGTAAIRLKHRASEQLGECRESILFDGVEIGRNCRFDGRSSITSSRPRGTQIDLITTGSSGGVRSPNQHRRDRRIDGNSETAIRQKCSSQWCFRQTSRCIIGGTANNPPGCRLIRAVPALYDPLLREL